MPDYWIMRLKNIVTGEEVTLESWFLKPSEAQLTKATENIIRGDIRWGTLYRYCQTPVQVTFMRDDKENNWLLYLYGVTSYELG